MEAALLYLLKAHVVLALFVAAYYGLLRRLTFFTLNRAFLLLAVVVAVGYPLLPAPMALTEVAAHVGAPLGLPVQAAATLAAPPAATLSQPAAAFPWLLVGLSIYAAGSGILGLRLLGQLLSLARLRRGAQLDVVLEQAVWLVPGTGGAFSFGQDIYLTSSALADTENLPDVLRHEQAHVQQAHTFDALLLQLLVAAAWLNPAAWLLRRAALANLEYLADRAALPAGPGRYAYLRGLVSQQTGNAPVPALAFRPTIPTLKMRVLMLNQLPSSPRQLGRYLFAALLLAAGLLGLAACEHPLAKQPTRPPATVLLTKSTLIQPNGRPINVHRINKFNLGIELGNRYTMVLNALPEEEQRARKKEIAALTAKHDFSFANQEKLAKLHGFDSYAEHRVFMDKMWDEGVLANQEDPEFYQQLTEREQRAVEAVIYAHNRRTGGPTYVPLVYNPEFEAFKKKFLLKKKTILANNK
jgi:Zn-dependent protease with chaperone function